MGNSFHLKVLKSFRSPLTNRMAKVGDCMNAPKNRFWFKRIKEGDCEISKKAKKEKSYNDYGKNPKKDSKKGSK